MPAWGDNGNQTAGSGLGGGNIGGKGAGSKTGADKGAKGGKVGPNGKPVGPGGSVAAAAQPGGITGGAPSNPNTDNGGSIWEGIKNMFNGAMNPTGDPALSMGLKMAMGPIAPALAAVGALQAAGVPSTPANTDPNYGNTLADNNQGSPIWTDDSGALIQGDPRALSAGVDPQGVPFNGSVWTSGGVTGAHVPFSEPSPVFDQGADQPQGQPINPNVNVISSTTPASPLAKVVKSALSGKSSQKMVA